MGRIAVLDDNMINMIAAGEVIERPASIVKELLENSLDAGATRITVLVEDGGRKRIAVTDNGCGMDAEDLQLALKPHATSKVRQADDLHVIRTMGFRGEALASIASVAQVTLISRTADSIQANLLSCDCGQRESVRPASADVGTTVDVRNLFYKLPARRKFLRTANTEMTHIIEHFTRIALANLSLDLTLIHNTRETYRLLGGQTLTERVGILFGKELAETMMPIRKQEKGMEITGLIGKPAAARTSSTYQYVFLNRRFIRDKFIQHAVRQAYQGLMEPNRYPAVFLFLKMPPEQYDVNVHPTKVEVRFENSNLVHSQVLAALRDKLLSTNLDVGGKIPPSMEFGPLPDSGTEGEFQRRQRILDAVEDFFKKPASSQKTFEFKSQRHEPLFGEPSRTPPETIAPDTIPAYRDIELPIAPQKYLQVQNSYLLLATEQGFEVIDQHALHERILFEKLCEKIRQGRLASQRFLTPVVIQVTPQQEETMEHNAALFDNLGIELSLFGPGTIAIQAFPILLEKAEPGEFVRNLLDTLASTATADQPEDLLKEILERAACIAAVKAGQPLTETEVVQLLADRQKYPQACRCPHGRPATLTFSIAELEKQFKRTGF